MYNTTFIIRLTKRENRKENNVLQWHYNFLYICNKYGNKEITFTYFYISHWNLQHVPLNSYAVTRMCVFRHRGFVMVIKTAKTIQTKNSVVGQFIASSLLKYIDNPILILIEHYFTCKQTYCFYYLSWLHTETWNIFTDQCFFFLYFFK